MKFSSSFGAAAWLAFLLGGCAKQGTVPAAPPPPPAVTLVPAGEKSPHFDAVNRHLELGGSLYGYVDIDGDMARLAGIAQKGIAQFGGQVPQLEALKTADLEKLFQLLGLNDLAAAGASSVREADGEFRNRAFLATPNGRRGILRVGGGPAHPFTDLDIAPEDADVYEQIEFDLPALASAVKQVMIQVQGKDAEQKVEAGMNMAGAMAGVSIPKLIHDLKGHATVLLRIDPAKTITIPGAKPVVLPAFSLLLGIEGIGQDLTPVLDKAPYLQSKVDGARKFYTPKIAMMVPGIQPAIAVAGTTLYLSTSEFFLHECLDRAPGSGLSRNADFQRLLHELGPDGNMLVYVSPRLLEQIRRIPSLNPGLDPHVRQVLDFALSVQPEMHRPMMSVIQNESDGILFKGRMNQSLKPQLVMLAAYNPFLWGMMAGANLQKRAATAPAMTPQAGRRPLRIFWTDVEGGGATLIVTPAGQSVLIDSGNPGQRDSGRIRRTARIAGIRQIDYYITTHFHLDHFGGAAELSSLIPIEQVWDNGIPDHDPDHHPSDAIWNQTSRPYREFAVPGGRHVVQAGMRLPLRQVPGMPPLSLRCLAARQQFVHARPGTPPNPLADEHHPREIAPTANDDSSVWLLEYGPFRFWDGGDLTWNMEAKMVLPENRAGQVDVYQVDHHGLDVSNNPVLVHSLAPTVSVMNNGIRKGTSHVAIESLKSSPGIQAMYQLHRNLRPDDPEDNTGDGFIANLADKPNHPDAHYIELTVDPSGKSYVVSIPERHIVHVYMTRLDKR